MGKPNVSTTPLQEKWGYSNRLTHPVITQVFQLLSTAKNLSISILIPDHWIQTEKDAAIELSEPQMKPELKGINISNPLFPPHLYTFIISMRAWIYHLVQCLYLLPAFQSQRFELKNSRTQGKGSVVTTADKISFGGIPNSSSIDIPSLTTSAPFCASYPRGQNNQSHGCPCQGCKATNPTGTLHNLPNAASGTYTNTRRNSSEPSGGTFRTLPPEPAPTRAGTLRNPPEPSGTCLRNLPFYTGTLRNLTGTPADAGTLRNFPEPSGTFLRNLLLQPAPAHTGAYLGWRPH